MNENLLQVAADTAVVASGVKGNIGLAAAALAVPIAIALIGLKAVEAVGRNPGASTKILVQSIIAMAFAEAIIFFVIFLGASM